MTHPRRWADEAMFSAAPMKAARDSEGNIIPQVHLLWMTPDPLGAVAAMCRMYEGKPTYSLTEISEYDRLHYFEQVQKTHLRAPLEAVKLHFFIEGVTRSFTHQMVRQRTAVYAQESLRFAVKEDLANEISMPPSIARLKKDDPARTIWTNAVNDVENAYNSLISAGIPAEDVRGLAPHAVTTRLHYVTDLRNLSEHAGNRLCTQAQFEWRIVFLGMISAIRGYPYLQEGQLPWQFDAIANSGLFRPICYQLGRCPFKAEFDRACSIRGRVEDLADVPSKDWSDPMVAGNSVIDPSEWLADPTAARQGGAGHS